MHCKKPGCNRPVHARGYCGSHYGWARSNGEIEVGPRFSPEERFWSRVDKNGPIPEAIPSLGRCWIWTRSTVSNGYGIFTANGDKRKAHCHAYIFEHGEIPEGMFVDHRCWNRACVRPSHLRAIPHAGNCQNRSGAMPSSKTGVRGVHWDSHHERYIAQATMNGKRAYQRYFTDLHEADIAVTRFRAENYKYSDVDRERLKLLEEENQ